MNDICTIRPIIPTKAITPELDSKKPRKSSGCVISARGIIRYPVKVCTVISGKANIRKNFQFENRNSHEFLN